MFTGIIIEMGEVVALSKKEKGGIISINSAFIYRDAMVGDSISINGVCLTVVEKKGSVLSFDISDETMRSTNLGQLRRGDRVNLEPALRADGKVGGHFVTGHVDGVGVIKSKMKLGDSFKIFLSAPQDITGLLVGKGSVAIDGISLTVVNVSNNEFSVVIIPHTARVTTIGFKGAGDTVNIEADIIGKYVARFMGKITGKNEINSISQNYHSEEGLIKALTRAGIMP